MKCVKYAIFALAALGALSSCEKSASEVYTNKAFIEDYASSKTLYVSIENKYSESLVAVLPKPAESALKVRYVVDASEVDYYNQKYGTEAVLLPEKFYSFSATEFTFNQGAVRTEECVISFKDVLSLNKDSLYVLPVVLQSDDIDVLSSRSTKFYVFEGANLINDVAYMWENYCTIDWHNKEVLSNLKQITIEMLLNSDWNKVKTDHSENNSFFGVEGYFLFRTGDLANDPHRLQICTNSGEPLTDCYMPDNEWFNLIVTYDCDTRALTIYKSGVKVATATAGNYPNGLSFYTGDDNKGDLKKTFNINTAYNPNRNAAAFFSEVRIWNKILDEETIADQEMHPYFVDPASDGLVAYWKFNEGSGTVIADRTGNGNDAVAVNPVVWSKVALPE